jgi:pimeloyl-ACP methyl ester carboxylesterase
VTRYVDAEVRLAYETSGAGEPPMLFVHGWSCDRSYFAAQFAAFAASHAVASLDLRGHGDSGCPASDDYQVENFADDVLAVARAAGFDRPVIVGHSLGGLVALACAMRADAVRAAVLVEPAPLGARGRAYFAERASDVAGDAEGSWRAAWAGGLFLPTDNVRREETIAAVAAKPLFVAASAWRAIADFDGAAALARTQVPVLAITAGRPESALHEPHPLLTLGRTVGAGHFVQLEVPEQVNAMIDRFLLLSRRS